MSDTGRSPNPTQGASGGAPVPKPHKTPEALTSPAGSSPPVRSSSTHAADLNLDRVRHQAHPPPPVELPADLDESFGGDQPTIRRRPGEVLTGTGPAGFSSIEETPILPISPPSGATRVNLTPSGSSTSPLPSASWRAGGAAVRRSGESVIGEVPGMPDGVLSPSATPVPVASALPVADLPPSSPPRRPEEDSAAFGARVSPADGRPAGAGDAPVMQEVGERFEPGGVIGDYILLDQIGEGGMAVIFKARHVRTGQIVAIKALHAHQQTALASARFDREWRAMSSLNHPNIVRLYSRGTANQQPYIVMEFVEGHDLKAHLKVLKELPEEKRWAAVEAIVLQLCGALEAIHSRALLHRDLKPSNLLITPEGRMKLTDFGVARSLSENEGGEQLTQPGMLVGTLAYLAPEVFAQQKITHLVDLYALGVMLYVMLTDKLPFSGKNIVQIMQKHLNHIPEEPHVVDPRIPPRLSAITMKLLSKQPAERFQTAQEVTYAIQQGRKVEVLDEQTAEVTEARPQEEALQPRFIGREAEKQIFSELIDTLRTGGSKAGEFVVVVGEVGSGRTRLISHALTGTGRLGIPVYSGRCVPNGQEWCEGFRGVVREAFSEVSRAGCSEKLAANFSRLATALKLQEQALPATQPPPPEDDALRDDLVDTFYQLALKSPRVIWIDDIDLADDGTLQVLSKLRNMVTRGFPLLVVVSCRPLSAGASPELVRLVTEERAGRRPRQILLGNLKLEDSIRLVDSLFPGDLRVPALATRIFQDAAGNPMTTVEQLRYLADRSLIKREKDEQRWQTALSSFDIKERLPLPRSLGELLSTRLQVLPQNTRPLLEVVAVWGHEMQVATVAKIFRKPDQEISRYLEPLKRTGWVVDSWVGGTHACRLAHPFYRIVLLREMTPEKVAQIRSLLTTRTRG